MFFYDYANIQNVTIDFCLIIKKHFNKLHIFKALQLKADESSFKTPHICTFKFDNIQH